MALEVGSVFARLGAKVDEEGFHRFDQRVEQSRRMRAVQAELGGRFDPVAFQRFEQQAERARRTAADKQAFKVALGGEFNPTAFRAYERELDHVNTQHARATESSHKMGDGWAYAKEKIGPLRLGVSGLAGALVGGVGAFGLFEAVKAVDQRMQEQQATNAKLAAGLKSTGDAAHVSTQGLDELAKSIQDKTGIDGEQIKTGEQILLMFRGVRNELGQNNDIYDRAIRLGTDLSVRTGRQLQPTMIALGKALNDPVKGLGLLARYGIQVDEGTKAQIKSLTQHGHVLAAQKLVLDAVNKSAGGTAEAYGKTMPGAISRARLALLDMGTTILSHLAPSITKGADKVATFVSQMESGKGAGGRFAHTVKDIGGAILSVLGPIAKFVGHVVKFVAQHKALRDMVGAIVAVAVAVKAIQFAGAITGVTKLLGLLGTLGKAKAGEAVAQDLTSNIGGVPGALEKDGGLLGRFKSMGGVFGKAMGGMVGTMLVIEAVKHAKGLANKIAAIVMPLLPGMGDQPVPGMQPGKQYPVTSRPAAGGSREPPITSISPAGFTTPSGMTAKLGIDATTSAVKRLTGAQHDGAKAGRDYTVSLQGQAAAHVKAQAAAANYDRQVRHSGEVNHDAARNVAVLETSIEGLRSRLSKLTPGTQAYNRTAAELAQKQREIHAPTVDLQHQVDTLRDRLSHLKRGSDDYNRTAAELKIKQDLLNRAVKDGQTPATNLGKTFGGVSRATQGLTGDVGRLVSDALSHVKPSSDNARGGVHNLGVTFGNLGGAVVGAGNIVKTATNRLLSQFHATPISFDVGSSVGNVGQAVSQSLAGLMGNARGGLVPGGEFGHEDKMILVDPSGRPRAKMAGDEGILTRHQMPVVDAALRMAGFKGGLHELWAKVNRPHAYEQGGKLPGFAEGGGIAAMIAKANDITSHHYPYLWGGGHDAGFTGPYDCSGAVSAVLHAAGLLNLPMVSGQFAGWGLPGPGPVTINANDRHVWMSILGKAFGTSGSNPGGGAGWFGGMSSAGYTVRNAPVSGAILPRVTVGGSGPLHTIGQDDANMVRSAAEHFIISKMAASGQVGGGDWGNMASGPWVQVLESIARSRGWNAADWEWIVQHESGGNPNAVNPNGGATGLGQMLGANIALYHGNGTPAQQIAGMGQYIADRYGNPTAARAFWEAHNWYGQGGLLPGFQTGGSLAELVPGIPAGVLGGSPQPSGNRRWPGTLAQPSPDAKPGGGLRELSLAMLDPMIAHIASLISREGDTYSVASRRAGELDISNVVSPGDPTATPPVPPTINQRVWKQHENDLLGLLGIRQKTLQLTRNEYGYMHDEIRLLRTQEGRFRRMIAAAERQLKRATGKNRAAIGSRLGKYKGQYNTTLGKLKGLQDSYWSLGIDVQNAGLDVVDAQKELQAWSPGALLAAGATSGGGGSGSGAPSAADIAAAAQADYQQFQSEMASQFQTYGGNSLPVGANPFGGVGSDAGVRYFGAGGTAAAPLATDRAVVVQGDVINHFPESPGDPHGWLAGQQFILSGMGG